MADIFSGLEGFGIKNIDNIDVFEKEEKKAASTEEEQDKVVSEEDMLFDKSYTCPVCEH